MRGRLTLVSHAVVHHVHVGGRQADAVDAVRPLGGDGRVGHGRHVRVVVEVLQVVGRRGVVVRLQVLRLHVILLLLRVRRLLQTDTRVWKHDM